MTVQRRQEAMNVLNIEILRVVERPGTDSNAHGLPIGLTAVHRLASFLDRGQHRIISHGRLSGNERSLRLEVDVEGLDAYNSERETLCTRQDEELIPSSRFKTRSTAPEQPPQLIEMLNLYWWSDMAGVEGRIELGDSTAGQRGEVERKRRRRKIYSRRHQHKRYIYIVDVLSTR